MLPRPDDTSRARVEDATRGDRTAVEELLAQQLPGLRAFVRLRAGPVIRAKESCSDLAQSVCREVLEHLDDFEYRGEAAFRKWLYTAALRKIIDRGRYYRAERRDAAREKLVGEDDDALAACYRGLGTPSAAAMSREEVARIEAAFDELPGDYKEVITLARIVGLPHKKIAEHMGRSENAVTQLLFRALARLSWLLGTEQDRES